MERKIEKHLLGWKNSDRRKPLLLQGARQVGKTWSLLEFGKKYYKNLVYLNFESNPELHQIFERDLHPARILNELSAYSGQTILLFESLVIFDEIQACDRALTSLKYFQEEAPGYHIAAAGSLLGVAVNRNKYSFPVGKVDFLNMYPMDIEEVLMAAGQKGLIDIVRACYAESRACSLHSKLLDLYTQYLFTGGMPRVIADLIDNNDYNMVVANQKSIADAYIADMAKYASPAETVRIMAAFQSLPAQLAKDNRKFQYKTIKSGARANQFENALEWLVAAGMVIRCARIDAGSFPLIAHADNSSFKAYMNDTGLLCASYGVSSNTFMSQLHSMDKVKGALTENYVASALYANGFAPYYWESQGKAEIDFVLQMKDGDIIPLEVKSSENVRSKSLHQFVGKYAPAWSIRISAKNFGWENNIRSVPLYAVFCIEPEL